MGMPDTLEALIAFLKTDATVLAAVTVGTRVWIQGPPMQPQYSGGPAIMIVSGGGIPGTSDPVVNEAVSIRCYAATPWAARALYRKVFDALHRHSAQAVTVTGGTATLCRASQTGGPRDMQEPELGWTFCEATYRLWWMDRLS